MPLLSPTSGRPDYGLIIKPRFGWQGIGPMLGAMGWKILPEPLPLPLLPRSDRKVPPWVLSTTILLCLQRLFKQLEPRFELTSADLRAPRGQVNWNHRQWVFSIPKRLRIYFMYDRRLPAKLSQCAWKVLSLYLQQGVPFEGAASGAVVAVQTFGDFLNFKPHLHIFATDKATAYFSLKFSSNIMKRYLLSIYAGLETGKMEQGRLSAKDLDKMADANNYLSGAPLTSYDEGTYAVEDIRLKAMEQKSRAGLDVLVIDYLQLLTSSDEFDNRQEESPAILLITSIGRRQHNFGCLS